MHKQSTDKWASMGGSKSPLGAAKTDEQSAARGGRFNEFQNGFIYWHPKFGAHTVYGLIGVKWKQLGRENSLGYPITDELPSANGGRFNDFENNAVHSKEGSGTVFALWNIDYQDVESFSLVTFVAQNIQIGNESDLEFLCNFMVVGEIE